MRKLRRATVTGNFPRGVNPRTVVAAYLPRNYFVEYVRYDGDVSHVVVAGRDVAGWTLDTYVLPRLASGLYWGVELEGAA